MDPGTSSSKKAKLTNQEIKNRGAPTKCWEEKGNVAKRKEIREFSETLMHIPREKLLMAVARVMKKSGEKDLADILEATSADINLSKALMKKINLKTESVVQISPQKGLAMLFDANLGKTSYQAVQRAVNSCGKKVIPCYDRVRVAKSDCSPPLDCITVTELAATVTLKALLEHTAARIVEYQKPVFLQEKENVHQKVLTFILSWGMDGSSGFSNYKQGYLAENSGGLNEDSSFFAITINPLRIHGGGKIFWNNSTPQSYRFCRPMKIMFAKESKDLVLTEYNAIQKEIAQLNNFDILLANDFKISINFSLHFTIIDGKVLSFIQGTSNQACPVCWCNPKQFNIIENLGNDVFGPKPNTMLHGLSCLHAYIRSLEYLLKLGYRVSFKQWQARGDLKTDCKREKERIQKQLWEELHLRVDFPNPTGGTSNDGNTARRAFQNYETFARILNIREDIILDFRTILIALNSQFAINPSRFRTHCHNLYHKLMQEYHWYLLPSSIHKILVHGAEIIASSPLPVGMLAEDCAESRNKCYKFDRTHRSRKTNRKDTLSDMFMRALGTSDPVISSISLKQRANVRKRKSLPPEVIALLDEVGIAFDAVPHSKFDLVDLTVNMEDEEEVLENESEI